MNTEPVHRYFGTPLSNWIAAIPNGLEIDAVGLWQVIPALRLSFGLDGKPLERAVRQALAGLLARGARPVVGSSARHGSWKRTNRYGDDPDAIIDAVMAEWHAMGRDPDVGDLWFALPRFLLET